jgi:hypothetical protein
MNPYLGRPEIKLGKDRIFIFEIKFSGSENKKK